jgi:hypothetical protein
VTKGTPKLIASTWLHEKNDRPLNPQCKNQIILIPESWPPKHRGLDLSDVGPAAPPPEALRDADNELIAASTAEIAGRPSSRPPARITGLPLAPRR